MNNSTGNKKQLSAEQREELLGVLKERFEKNRNRHKGLDWAKVQGRICRLTVASTASPGLDWAKVQGRICGMEVSAEKLWSLQEMERTGGEPDVVGQDKKSGEILFFDCSAESPKGRVSFCYDREALDSRKEHKPKNNVVDMATEMGVELLTEAEYFALQKLGEFDTKTSSWIATPPEIRKLGGALYGDRRYGRVFIGHNGAQSYYAARGFRASLRV